MTDDSGGNEGRRPLKVRNVGWSRNIARWLSGKNITPNQISVVSVFFAAGAALCLFYLPYSSGILPFFLPICVAVLIQCRLLCNLFDGMVAVEGGKGTASGELFNDIPDRIADPLILIAAGYSITVVEWGITVGWLAAILSVMTAYVRTLAASLGAPVSFQGPMAKQHRMALVTIASIISVVEYYILHQSYAMLVALIIIAVGCGITLYRRSLSAYSFLEKNNP